MKVFVIFLLLSSVSCQNSLFPFPININPGSLFANLPFNLTEQEILNYVSNYVFNYQYCDDFETIFTAQNECTKQLRFFCKELSQKKLWALKMMDASAKPQSGILYGNIMHIGNFDECLRIDEFIEGHKIQGKYCTVGIQTNYYTFTLTKNAVEDLKIDPDILQQMRLSIGFCLPAACEATFLQENFYRLSNKTQNKAFSLEFNENYCDWKGNHESFETRTIVGICIFGFFGILVLLSTLYDVFVFQKSGKGSKLYIAFSFYSNGKRLFSTNTSEDSLQCLNGIRVISMMWIILGHRYLYSLFLPTTNLPEILELVHKTENMFIFAANMAVDSFFCVSGLLLMYVFLRNKEKGHKSSVCNMYIHRILRLSPSLAMVIVFTVTLLDGIGTGPFWVAHDFFVQQCEDNWWSTMLYLQNYLNPQQTCVGQSWYLAVDTQLYFLSPIILFSIIRWPKRIIFATLFAAFLSSGLSFELTWQNEYGASFMTVNPKLFDNIYVPTHMRASPWLIGMVCGYIIFKYKDKFIKIHKVLVIIIWLSTIGVMTGIILYHIRFVVFEGEEKFVSLIETSLFNALARPIWGFALCIVILLCVFGHGGFVNKFLSCPLFNILIRVNYNMYLLHILVIIYFLGQKRTADYITNNTIFHAFWGDFSYTLMISIIWTLTFESPIIVLEKIIFNRRKKSNRENGYSVNPAPCSILTVSSNGNENNVTGIAAIPTLKMDTKT